MIMPGNKKLVADLVYTLIVFVVDQAPLQMRSLITTL